MHTFRLSRQKYGAFVNCGVVLTGRSQQSGFHYQTFTKTWAQTHWQQSGNLSCGGNRVYVTADMAEGLAVN